MTGSDAMPGFDAAERALLDGFVVPPPRSDLIDQVVAAALADAPAMPPLRKAARSERQRFGWRRAWQVAGAVGALGIVTAAAAERGAFGPAVQERVQVVVARAIGDDAPVATPPAPKRINTPPAPAPLSAGSSVATDITDARIAPMVEKLRRDPQLGARIDRALERRKARQIARGETPTPLDMADLARRYAQLSPERRAELRRKLATLPPEQQAEIRAIIRDYRKARRGQVTSQTEVIDDQSALPTR
ncbi:MAG: hypothetical protein B7Y36_09190 [Novosphingobium sp. 28-62-57]|uniref:hypothetical protein n=1 Tax=unclassified Novosphingobium TaxID=2644732 RepID=UPI000BD67E2C|nr:MULTISPECIES: hypothetical protein [unclassified Novosphingobium]OYW51475.1 MAG: hypothetical protein B7Z34_01390 [Novosphingobium sp. 12-62-10]OYZ10390.1 MAG: hypothetical protein B7Y36_09190 [Novosphingobium sp. 28-62-57]OZA40730.1 MAG: hypothetical protein B7X92_00765 [Novosphingobium sp. 17-62-9]HQS68214.1 hypothetical protein [Novosphingobium sp.]